MRTFSLDAMVKGWFVGAFTPVAVASEAVEVAVKYYAKGDVEALHHHKLARECTVVAQGQVRMNGVVHVAGSIIVLERNEATDFEVLEDDTITVVVKMPSVAGDKYSGPA